MSVLEELLNELSILSETEDGEQLASAVEEITVSFTCSGPCLTKELKP